MNVVNLKNIKTATLSAIFGQAVSGVRKQGGPSFFGRFAGSAYRSSPRGDRRACPFGHLIGEGEYKTSMEGKALAQHPELMGVTREELKESKAILIRYELVKALQEAHDMALSRNRKPLEEGRREVEDDGFLTDFNKNVAQVAKDFGLKGSRHQSITPALVAVEEVPEVAPVIATPEAEPVTEGEAKA